MFPIFGGVFTVGLTSLRLTSQIFSCFYFGHLIRLEFILVYSLK